MLETIKSQFLTRQLFEKKDKKNLESWPFGGPSPRTQVGGEALEAWIGEKDKELESLDDSRLDP